MGIPSAPSSNSYNSYDYGLSNVLNYPTYDSNAYGSNAGNAGSFYGQNFGEGPISSYGYTEGSRARQASDLNKYAMWEADFWRHWDGKQATEISAAKAGHRRSNQQHGRLQTRTNSWSSQTIR